MSDGPTQAAYQIVCYPQTDPSPTWQKEQLIAQPLDVSNLRNGVGGDTPVR